MWLLLHKQFYHVFSGWFFVSLLFTKEFTEGLGIAPSSPLQFSSNFLLCIFNETQIIITCIKFTLDITITGKYVWNTKLGMSLVNFSFCIKWMENSHSQWFIYSKYLGFFSDVQLCLKLNFSPFSEQIRSWIFSDHGLKNSQQTCIRYRVILFFFLSIERFAFMQMFIMVNWCNYKSTHFWQSTGIFVNFALISYSFIQICCLLK